MRNPALARRGIYILPSLFTTGGLFAGFYALIAAIQGRYELAAWAIIFAAVFDMLDGRVARLLHAESSFGAEYDSLCDMVSFGLAPAVLIYMWALVPMGKFGWLASFMIAACAALRLARFNIQVGTADKRYFQGLPTPATALLIATAVLFHEDMEIDPHGVSWLWLAMAVALALLMVSNIRFFSGKDVDLKQRRAFSALVGMLLFIVLVMSNPYVTLFLLMLVYCTHGVVLSVWQGQKAARYRMARRKARAKERQAEQTED